MVDTAPFDVEYTCMYQGLSGNCGPFCPVYKGGDCKNYEEVTEMVGGEKYDLVATPQDDFPSKGEKCTLNPTIFCRS